MQEQYITDVCLTKMKDIINRIHIISSRIGVSYRISKFFGDYYYCIDIHYTDKHTMTKTTTLSIFESYLYETSVEDIMLRVIESITKDLLIER